MQTTFWAVYLPDACQYLTGHGMRSSPKLYVHKGTAKLWAIRCNGLVVEVILPGELGAPLLGEKPDRT